MANARIWSRLSLSRATSAFGEPILVIAGSCRLNTDMILLPRVFGQSVTTLVGPLGDGLYHLPRFELPEAFWESLPRTDPGAIFQAVENWAGRIQFDEVTLSDPWNLYDAPGDFQLFPRTAIFEIDGFDEAMCHGWHVNSNIARRLSQYFGETRPMEGLRGYHCNHSRVASIYQGAARTQNDAAKYVYGLTDIYLPSQRNTWGLPDERLEEIDMGRSRTFQFAERVFEASGTSDRPRREVRQTDDESFWEFSDHVFLHLASALEPLPRSSQITYFGFNGRMLQQLANFVKSSGFRSTIAVSPIWKEVVDGFDFVRAAFAPFDRPPVDLNADVLVFDFAIDCADKDKCPAFERARPPLPYLQLCELFLQAVSCHRKENGAKRSVPALFVVSSAFYFPIYQLVEANIAGPSGSFHSRIRQGYVRPDPAPWFDDKWPGYREVIGRSSDALSARRQQPAVAVDAWVRSEPIRTSLENGRVTLRKGWLSLESNGIWTVGLEADLSLIVPLVSRIGCSSSSNSRVSAALPASIWMSMYGCRAKGARPGTSPRRPAAIFSSTSVSRGRSPCREARRSLTSSTSNLSFTTFVPSTPPSRAASSRETG